jgi:hypothetical protein
MTRPHNYSAARRAAVLGAVALLPLALAAPAGAAKGLPAWTAVTVISSRPDSGNHDNPAQGANRTWANDSFTRTASVTFYAQVASSFCPGISSGECYYWTGEMLDSKGTFTTNPTAASGAYSPGAGTDGTGATGPFTIGATATGSMTGRYHFGFYATADSASTSGVPSAENDHGTLPLSAATSTCTGGSSCGVTNCHWIEQFFPRGTHFWDLGGDEDPACLGLYWSWYYFLPAGGDESCAQVASNWVTASWNNLGKDPVDGNIFAPGDTDC